MKQQLTKTGDSVSTDANCHKQKNWTHVRIIKVTLLPFGTLCRHKIWLWAFGARHTDRWACPLCNMVISCICCELWQTKVCEQCRQIWLTSFVGAGRQVLVRRFGNAANRQLRQGFARKARRQLKQHGQRRRSWGQTLTQDVQIVPHSHQANREIWGPHGGAAEVSGLLGCDTWRCVTRWHCDMWHCVTRWRCDTGWAVSDFQRFVVPSSSRSSNSWTIKPQRWTHYDPSTCQEPLAQWLGITWLTSQQPNVRSNSTVTVSHSFNSSLQVRKTLKEIISRYFVQFYMTAIFISAVFGTHWTTIPHHYPSKFSL